MRFSTGSPRWKGHPLTPDLALLTRGEVDRPLRHRVWDRSWTPGRKRSAKLDMKLQLLPAGRCDANPRVLLIAEAANPDWFSEPLLGWSHSQAIAAVTPTHLVTQERNREAILRARLPAQAFTAINSEAIAAPICRLSTLLRGGSDKAWTTFAALNAISYPYFEWLVWKKFASRLRRGEFDLVHRLTPVSPTLPSLLATKLAGCGIPFVLGPLNGGTPWPAGFDSVRQKEREWLGYLRGAHKLLPGYESTRGRSAAIIVASCAAFNEVSERYRDKCVYIPENAIDPARFNLRVAGPVRTPLRVAFVGRLVPYKGADMLLEAAAPLIRQGKLTVDIIGDGPEMPWLRRFVAQEGIATGVRLDGWVEHSQLQHRLVQSDIFGFPSVREFGGAVVLEAMALGLVPIVLDYGGPAELVTESTGYLVPIGQRTQIVASFRQVLTRLAADPSGLRQMGKRARNRVLQQFTWEAKARQVLEVYRWAVRARPDKPNFGMPFPDSPRLVPSIGFGGQRAGRRGAVGGVAGRGGVVWHFSGAVWWQVSVVGGGSRRGA